MTHNPAITDLMNETGFPFQKWCLETIRNLHKDHHTWQFRAIPEWPFTHPPSNGPLLGIHGTVDIIAIRGVSGISEETILFLVIECKRAKSDFKNWIFTNDKQNRRPVFVYSDVDQNLNEKRYITRQLTFPKLGYPTLESFDHCNNVIEINERFSSINRNQEEKAYKAIRQANHAVFALENKVPKYIENLTTGISLDHIRHFICLPIVITTAKLYLADFSYKQVINGDIQDKDVNYVDKSWLTYEFPLPDFLGYGREKDPRISTERRTTFIVNAKHLGEFLDNVGNMYGDGATLRADN